MASLSQRGEQVLEDVLATLRERVKDKRAAVIEEFLRQYLVGVYDEDLAAFRTLDLYGAALAHWNFLRQRTPGEGKVRVYNPQYDAHGWQSTHTIVELVCDDMPFLVDSVRMVMDRRGLTVHLLIHPVMRIRRNGDGEALQAMAAGEDPQAGDVLTEAVMHFEVDRLAASEDLEGLEAEVRAVLCDVRHAVADWKQMRAHLHQVLEQLRVAPPPLPAEMVAEGREFLEWVDNNHFTFLGYQEFELQGEVDDLELVARSGTGLGVLRAEQGASQAFAQLTPEMRRIALEPELLVLTKSNSRSTVHRPSHMDYIGVKQFDTQGKVVGERRFLGLYTSAAYNRVPRDIPLLRDKVRRVVERAGYPGNSHAAKALINILDNLPRDELFQLSADELHDTAVGILHLQERRRIRLFIHRDRFGRFFSCIVYVPRERFNTANRSAIQEILEKALGAHSSEFNVYLSESVLARLYFLMRVRSDATPQFEIAELEERLRQATRSWNDDLNEAALEHFGEARGQQLMRRYGSAFHADYREYYAPRIAVRDIEHMEALGEDGARLALILYRPLEAAEDLLHLKVFHLATPVSLSDALPMLENMGLKVEHETPSKVKRVDGPRVWVHDFGLRVPNGADVDLEHVRALFQDAFERVFHAEIENDGFNRLVLAAGLGWRDIVVLRAYAKYLRQLGFTFSQHYMEDALAANPRITRALVAFFNVRFDPAFGGDRQQHGEACIAQVREGLEAVANLDEDRILRAYLGLIGASTRTNHFQRDAAGQWKTHLSIKFDPARILEMPRPRPMYEIFVYSPRVEGVHLRGGAVARGGLRWSDRREDFRTEVLGLVKAQMVKNAVIVPVGSKGGFYPKRMPQGDREAMQAEGVACYRIFIRALLDITDNLDAGVVVPPPDVVRHDGDDPYLVVAADKGTATFSDIANAIAIEYGFWLGDAFASGGSAGYDHKGMGITARGAWESVKRHFRECGLDTQREDFSVVGIGDMSGDVFGNGMLLSRHIRLLGAFNHLHIFVDPDPDPERSFAERERLFALPRSSWEDYDSTLISPGGGVYSRKLKSIAITAPMRDAFGIEEGAEALTPAELIAAMLRAPVDLLWNGGIGTYVKASHERHGEVGDRANDALRADARDLRCRVIGEGGNLGVTQLGRIEFAANGGRVNTDAIDNSAGVDCSDHEVNIKILLNDVVKSGDMTGKQRNELLAAMTEEVGELVLRDNYLQTQVLSMASAQSRSMFDVHTRLMRAMERAGALDRSIEYLPGEDDIIERRNDERGLFASELSVLMAYVKIELFKDLLESGFAADDYLTDALLGYFPTPLREHYADRVRDHRLAAEIISTVVTNEVVNRAGITFCFRMREETGASFADICRAYIIAREVFAMPQLWDEVEALDNVAQTSAQIEVLLEARKLGERAARWLLRNRARPLDIAAAVAAFRDGVADIAQRLPELLGAQVQDAERARTTELAARGIPDALAQRVSSFDELFSALDIVSVAADRRLDVGEVAATYIELGRSLGLDWLRARIIALPRENRWQTLARTALRDDLYASERVLTADVLARSKRHKRAQARVNAWIENNTAAVARCQQVLADLQVSGQTDFAMLSVAMGEIRALQRGS
jgi:glutamate dehydrogenase